MPDAYSPSLGQGRRREGNQARESGVVTVVYDQRRLVIGVLQSVRASTSRLPSVTRQLHSFSGTRSSSTQRRTTETACKRWCPSRVQDLLTDALAPGPRFHPDPIPRMVVIGPDRPSGARECP